MPDPKPKLKAKVIPVYRVHYQDLERYIKEVFRFDYDLQFATGFGNGMCPEYQVTGDISATMARQVRDLRQGLRTKNLVLILNVLVADGYIPAGKWIIDTHKRPDLVDVYRDLLLRARDPLASECLEFKARYKDDPRLMDRVVALDRAASEQLTRARR